MTDEPRAGPARCFHLTIRLATSDTTHCRAPVRWVGVIRTADGVDHPVASCDTHVDHLEDRSPFPRCGHASDDATNRLVVFSEHN